MFANAIRSTPEELTRLSEQQKEKAEHALGMILLELLHLPPCINLSATNSPRIRSCLYTSIQISEESCLSPSAIRNPESQEKKAIKK